jgi:serine-threonine kinase receptor-associated protein
VVPVPANRQEVSPGIIDPNVIPADRGFEIGAGVHKGTIKSIVWTIDPNVLVTVADDKIIRWWDLKTRTVVQEKSVVGEIGSCEITNVKCEHNDIGGGLPVLAIAAGKTVYFYGGPTAQNLLKSIVLPYNVASVALHPGQRKFVTGALGDTWAKVYDYDSEEVLGNFKFYPPISSAYFSPDIHKGHHGPIWSISFSPDGKLYATGSEDGTIKMWKNCTGAFGLWRADKE